MNSTLARLTTLVAAAGFAACGGSTDLVTDELSEVEAQEFASALMLATFNSAQSIPQQPQLAPGGPQAAPYGYSFDFEGDVECPLGGSVAVTASLEVDGDTETEAGTVDYTITQVHGGCVVSSEEGEHVFTLWGAPNLVLDFLVASNGAGVIEWSGSVLGNVEWVTEGRQGTCAVALEFGGRQEGEASLAAEVAGSVCGFAVSQELMVG